MTVHRITFTALQDLFHRPSSMQSSMQQFKVHCVDCETCRDGSDPAKLTDRMITVCDKGLEIIFNYKPAGVTTKTGFNFYDLR